ncbi:MAG: glycosyltransferase family 2 protein [Acidimicrobiia bacterium]|nr:glycosyltransferase family 2 protein [Acidimicrobiia bacterium]
MTALVGVVVVDHDGGALTLRCVESLLGLDWPPDRLRVVVVDNASVDSLAPDLEGRDPRLAVLRSEVNLGFAGGCNAGIRHLLHDVEYVGLLNNDAEADPGWLRGLVAALEGDPSAGAAGSKVLFASQFVEVELEVPVHVRGRGDRRPLGVQVLGARVDGADVWSRTQLVHGFWGPEYDGPGRPPYQWSAGRAVLRVPVGSWDRGPAAARPKAELLLAADSDVTAAVRSGPALGSVSVGAQPQWCAVDLGGPAVDVVNSAGVDLVAGGFGADRGYLEVDTGQYDGPAEVFAWSGASVLLTRAYLESAGLFDDRFFLYYEDFDLAWRGRLRGWRHVYAPASVARHVHAATTGLASPLQDHYVERNRLLTLVRNAPAPLAWSAVVRFLLVTVSYARRDVVARVLRGRRPNGEAVRRRLGSFVAFLRLAPAALAGRRRARRGAALTEADLRNWMVTVDDRVVGTRE